MDIRHLRYFITIVNEGNISNAAKALNMSQPPLSTQIRLLEEELGCALFDRNTRHIQLTGAGEILYERAKAILELLSDTRTELNDYKKGLSGTIRIGIVSSVGSTAFTRWIMDFHNQYPDIRYALTEGNTYDLVGRTRSSQIDLALVRTPFSAPDLAFVPLKEEKLVAIGQEGFFRDRSAQDIVLEDLAAAPLIIYRRWETILRSTFQAEALSPDFICINDDARTTVYLAGAGLGMGIVPASVIPLAFPAPAMVKPVLSPALTTGISMIYRKEAYLPAVARLLIDFLIRQSQIGSTVPGIYHKF